MGEKKGYKKYDDISRSICHLKNFDSFFSLKPDELDGYLGVCMVLAFIDGVNASLYEMSQGIGVNYHLLEDPFNRLKANYVFSDFYDIRNDTILLGKKRIVPNRFIGSKHQTEVAWGNLAGVSSGHTGLRTDKDTEKYG